MAQVSLSTLILRVRERSDQVGSQFVTDAELTRLINEGKKALDDVLVQAYGEDYFAQSATFLTTVSTENYSLSVLTTGSFYKLLSLSQFTGNGWIDCDQYNKRDRNMLRSAVVQSLPGYGFRYRVMGPNLSLLPVPTGQTRLEIMWVPISTTLVASSDAFDDINGYSEFIVLNAAIAVKDKEESDTSVLQADRALIVDRILAAAPNRDAGEPMTVADVQAGSALGAFGFPWRGPIR